MKAKLSPEGKNVIRKDGLQPVHMGNTVALPSLRMICIAPNQLKDVWASVRDDLASIDSPEAIIPEEVYAMCYTNQASLFLLEVEGKRVGFMVVRLILPDLHLWLVHAENGYEVLKTFRTELMGLARNTKAEKLTFGSRRRAWQNVAVDHGFNVRMIVYECPVQ